MFHMDGFDAVNRNIELKARFLDLAAGSRAARAMGATLHAVERQLDTYFNAPRGRLKLRQRWLRDPSAPADSADVAETVTPQTNTRAGIDETREAAQSTQLIWYERPDEATARGSDYVLIEVADAVAMRKLLAAALGISVEVMKLRVVYLHDNVRIHLDDVPGLGRFIEFEAIVDDDCDNARAAEKLERLRVAFGVLPELVLSRSYAEMIGE